VSDGRIVDIVNDRHGLVGRSDLRQVGRAWREQLTPFWLPELRSALLAGTARIAGDATVRGRPAYRVALDLAPLDSYAPDTHVFVARDDHSMLRIDRQTPPLSAAPMPAVSRSEVLVYDVLPATPDHMRLLDLPPGLRRTPRSNAPPDGST
jgi:hypothetical protein